MQLNKFISAPEDDFRSHLVSTYTRTMFVQVVVLDTGYGRLNLTV